MQPRTRTLQILAVGLCLPAALVAQSVTLPPSGANQKASVTQSIGLVSVTIDYSSPDVTGPNGEDRTGKIWGQLVPFGLANLGFGTAKESPWRAGANENTVFTVSHDVEIEGKRLPAGSYGLHMIPGEREWTLIFSRNSSSWGSFFYDPSEDALRVTVEPAKAEFREWLTYDFIDRQPDRATVALHWEYLQVPWTVSVPEMVTLYVDNMRDELRSTAGFSWQGWVGAANYCVQNDTNLEEALQWAENSISMPFVGQENFTTLQAKSQVLAKLGKQAEADTVMARAIDHPTATAAQIHQYGRNLISAGRTTDAMAVFELNAKRFGGAWPTNVGLARGYSAVGKYDKALRYAELALAEAPDPLNKQNLENAVKLLADGKDIN